MKLPLQSVNRQPSLYLKCVLFKEKEHLTAGVLLPPFFEQNPLYFLVSFNVSHVGRQPQQPLAFKSYIYYSYVSKHRPLTTGNALPWSKLAQMSNLSEFTTGKFGRKKSLKILTILKPNLVMYISSYLLSNLLLQEGMYLKRKWDLKCKVSSVFSGQVLALFYSIQWFNFI